jgi:RecA/RadA recombinase
LSEETSKIEKTILNKKPKNKEKVLVRYSSGSYLLDILVGGGEGLGYPNGRMVNIIGDSSTGKTFLLCEIIAASYHKYKDKLKWVYDDCESGFTINTKKLYGFEIMPEELEDRTKSDTVEQLYCNVRKFAESLKKDEIGIYGVDSTDGLKSEADNNRANERYNKFKKNEKFDKGSYGLDKQKFLSKEFFTQLMDIIQKKKILLVMISQVRDNIDPFSFKKFYRAGGKAMDFYAHTCLWLANVNHIINKNVPIGITVKAMNDKSKTPRPYRSCYIKLFFEYGLDDITTNIDYLYDFLTPKGQLVKNPRGEWNEVSMNRKELIDYVEKNNLQKELRKKVRDKWEALEESVKLNRKPKYSE